MEDGTRCSLFTCSDQTLQPYDSQLTQDVCNNCLRICVRCSKTLIRNVAPLQHNMLLYLRHVETSVQFSSLLVGNVAQFEVKGGVELLPINTRLHRIWLNNSFNITGRIAVKYSTISWLWINTFLEEPIDIEFYRKGFMYIVVGLSFQNSWPIQFFINNSGCLKIIIRYHKTLVQRLKKENCHPLQPELREHLNHTAQHPVQPVVLTEIKEPTTFPVALRPAASSDMEISEFQSSPEAMEAFSSVPLHPFRTSKGD